MEKIIDLHTHLETLQDIYKFRCKLQNHIYSIKEHIKEDHQIILGVAMYVHVYHKYDDLILQIKTLKKEIDSFGDEVRLITKKADLEGDYKVGIILHVESARMLTNPEVQLPHLWELGIRGIIPVHFTDNYLGNTYDDPRRRLKVKTKDSGMSEAGRKFITLMNDLGMWVDLSHSTDNTFDDMCELANEVMVSHGAIREHTMRPRNRSIDHLKKIAAKGGVYGISPWQHLMGKSKDAYEEVLQMSLDYGLNHAVCFGTDLGAPIKSHETIKGIFDLAKIADKFKDDNEKIKWENAFHFFQRVLPD